MSKLKISSRWQRHHFVIVGMIFIPMLSFASEKLDSIGPQLVRDSVSVVACGEPRFLEHTGLTDEACKSKSKHFASYCWNGMMPLLPELRFEQEEFWGLRNEDAVLSLFFALEKCIQASILLTANNGVQHEIDESIVADSKQANRELPAGTQQVNNPDWLAFVETARSEFLRVGDNIAEISAALEDEDLFLVLLDPSRKPTGFKKEPGAAPVRTELDSIVWSDLLARANVVLASRTEFGTNLTSRSSLITESYEFTLSYSSELKSTVPECVLENRHSPGQSCEIERRGAYRAILIWSLLETSTENEIVKK